MDGSDAAGEVLVAAAADDEAGVADHVAEAVLVGEALDALDQVLVGVAVAGDELADERDGGEAPAAVHAIEQGHGGPAIHDLPELETREHASRPQHPVRLGEPRGDAGEVPDPEGDGVQVDAGVGDGVRGKIGGVGFEEGERGLLRGRQLRRCPLRPHGQHRPVDVGDRHPRSRVPVYLVRVPQHPERDVPRPARHIEDPLRCRRRGRGGARVQAPYEVVSGFGVSLLALGGGGGSVEGDGARGKGGMAYFHTRCHPKDIRSFMRS